MKKAVGYDNFLINEAGLNLRQSVRFYLLGTFGSFTVGEAHFASLVESTRCGFRVGRECHVMTRGSCNQKLNSRGKIELSSM